jgi:uncharacterized RDD family membrane protein YckC
MSSPDDPKQPGPNQPGPNQPEPDWDPRRSFHPPPPGQPQYPPPGLPQFPPPPDQPPPVGSGYQPAPPPPAGYGYGEAGAVAPGMYFDPGSGLTLPQGTELASQGRRIGAFFLAIPLSIVTLGIGYLIWGAIVWARGTSPALQVLGMRVWRPSENRPANWGYMALRDIVGRFVDGVLSFITELISFIMFLSTRERRALHDVVAGTVVLHDPNKVIPQ